eukprot:jgi/Mesvir1/27843/Mv26403-RA.1
MFAFQSEGMVGGTGLQSGPAASYRMEVLSYRLLLIIPFPLPVPKTPCDTPSDSEVIP